MNVVCLDEFGQDLRACMKRPLVNVCYAKYQKLCYEHKSPFIMRRKMRKYHNLYSHIQKNLTLFSKYMRKISIFNVTASGLFARGGHLYYTLALQNCKNLEKKLYEQGLNDVK